jgi:hypothetical protein
MDSGWMDSGWMDSGWMDSGWMDAGWMAEYSKQMGRCDDEVKGSALISIDSVVAPAESLTG